MAGIRGRSYGNEELKQLCYSVLAVSQDSVVFGQRVEKFWDRVVKHYEKYKPKGFDSRGKKSLEGKWWDIKHDVAKFMGCYQQAEDLQNPGTNSDDTLNKAKELYQQNHPKGKTFAFECCYLILKECPRWGNPADDMARGHSEKSNASKGLETEKENSSPTPLLTENENGNSDPQLNEADKDDFGQSASKKRPNSSKRTKKKAKRVKLQHDALKMMAEAQKEMAAIGRKRVRIMEKNFLMKLLTLPCNNMHPELAEFIKEWKLEEVRKLRKRMQQQSAAPVRTVKTPPPETTD